MSRRTQTGCSLLPPCGRATSLGRRLNNPTLYRCPACVTGRGSGRRGARAPSGGQYWTQPAAAGSARGNEEVPTGLCPPENKQVFSGCREPRPSPLPSAGPLPLPSPGVGRCAWHIPHILQPVSSVLPPLPCSAQWSCWRNQGWGSPRPAQRELQKVLPLWKTSRLIPLGSKPWGQEDSTT